MKFKTTSNNLFIKMVFKNKLKNFLKKWLTNKKEFVKLKKLKRAMSWREVSAPGDIEIGGSRSLGWVLIVTLARRTELSTLVVVLRIDDFGRHGVVYIKLLHLSRVHLSAGIVTTLNHEVLDDSLEDAAVVVAAVHEFQKVVAMVRRIVIEGHTDITQCGFEQHFVAGGVARSLP